MEAPSTPSMSENCKQPVSKRNVGNILIDMQMSTITALAAERLDQLHIPFVVWGCFMLTIFGIPTIVDGIDLVVEDSCIVAAFQALAEEGFTECTCPDTCRTAKPPRYLPKAHLHLHVPFHDYPLRLYKKSKILWKIPDLSVADGDNIILASDKSRLPGPDILGHGGRLPEDFYPIRMPSMRRLVEALLLVHKRFFNAFHGFYYMNWITYIVGYCYENGTYDPETLSGLGKIFMEALRTGDCETRHRALHSLNEDTGSPFEDEFSVDPYPVNTTEDGDADTGALKVTAPKKIMVASSRPDQETSATASVEEIGPDASTLTVLQDASLPEPKFGHVEKVDVATEGEDKRRN